MSGSDNILFTKDHEWLSGNTGVVKIGISAHAIEQLGDVVHIELPDVEEKLTKGQAFGSVESTKTVSDIYIPVDATVVEVNHELCEHPEKLSEDPYDHGWLIKVRLTEQMVQGLMDSKEYADYIREERN